ncbi:hypothetical protein K2173_023889 [Erythroxylum novogranatense]|uniref:Uncharacterized protein n=1 Tax=Erythroxylum novogranatense TaxID=1862640 RepID=A0AAV8TS45_9ROSI|nr:hypothetical protein K2173_023889 [Erythroxylum novogranatense]
MSNGASNLRICLGLIKRYRSSYCNVENGNNVSSSSAAKFGRGYPMHQGLRLMSSSGSDGTYIKPETNLENDEKASPPPPAGPPVPRFNFPLWARWAIGSMLSLLLPFWSQKWQQLKRIEGEAEAVVDGVEKVAEVVERVATVAERVSEEVAEKLPEDGKLKEAALVLERVSKATVHDAQVAEEFIHKVDDIKRDLCDLEKMVEPVIEKLVPQNPEEK